MTIELQEALQKFERLSARFKELIDILEKGPKTVSMSDVQKDLIRCEARVEALDWVVRSVDLGHGDAQLLDEETKKTQDRYRLLKQVVGDEY
jgi:hypothetical protein